MTALRIWRSLACALIVASCASDTLPGVSGQGELLEQTRPVHPLLHREVGDEGWALVSIVVERDGSVAAPIVEDAVSSLYASEAVRSVRQWKWQPPTLEGQSVEQTQSVLVPFDLRAPTLVGSRLPAGKTGKGFLSFEAETGFEDIEQQLDTGDLKGAERALAKLDARGLSLRERAQFFLLDARLRASKGQSYHQLLSLKRALLSHAQSLDGKTRDEVESSILALQIQHQQLRAALDTYDRMLARRRAPPPEVVAAAADIRATRDGSQPIVTSGRLALRGEIEAGDAPRVWSHALLRRKLAVQDVTGLLESVDLRCVHHRQTTKTPAGTVWTLPESWGDCSVYVFGKPGTTFTLIEHSQQG